MLPLCTTEDLLAVFSGNKYLLQSHSMWSSLLDHYRKHKALVEASDFINALSG